MTLTVAGATVGVQGRPVPAAGTTVMHSDTLTGTARGEPLPPLSLARWTKDATARSTQDPGPCTTNDPDKDQSDTCLKKVPRHCRVRGLAVWST